MALNNVAIVLTGAYGNLGDAVIRRRALEWARPHGKVHAYVGNAPDGWIKQLGLTGSDVLYDSSKKWAWISRSLFDRSIKALFLDPGAVPLTRKHIGPETVLLVVSLALKLRGALVVRPPRSINPSSNLCLWIHRLGCRLSDVVLWRTEPSQRYAKVGQLAPDTAFGEPRTLGLAWSERKRLVVSMRGKRRFPSVQWFESIRDIASKADLDLIVVTQVREDEQRSAEIATELGAELHVWDQVEDIDQEVRLRELYETAAIVVSDRLHVLVLGAMAGAVPLELSDRPVSKILDTFAQVGMTDVVFDTASSQSSDAVRFAFRAVDGREKMSQKLDDANTRLKEALSSVHA